MGENLCNFEITFPRIQILCLVDSKKSGIRKFFYYARMTNISTTKSSSDLDNKELFSVSSSSYLKVCSSSDSVLVILSSLICTLWQKRKIHINTDFEVTGWMLCAIPHIRKDAKDNPDSDHRKQVNYVIKMLFCGLSKEKMAVT